MGQNLYANMEGFRRAGHIYYVLLIIAILEELHESHQGVSRMRGRPRMVLWWPNLDKEIENLASSSLSVI